MNNSSTKRTGRHCVFAMHVHLVFLTKYRGKVFTDTVLENLREIFAKVCGDFETELIEFNGEKEHVHLLVNHPPKVAVSKLVNSLKTASSRRLRKHPDLIQHYWRNALWSPSYFAASCGGAAISIIREYIEQQNVDIDQI